MNKKLFVEMPEFYLLTIAVHGNMGDGELPDIMRIWAQSECRRLGIENRMVELQNERLRELESRMRNVFGNKAVDKLSSDIMDVAQAIKKAK